jgi:hypothetical protein
VKGLGRVLAGVELRLPAKATFLERSGPVLAKEWTNGCAFLNSPPVERRGMADI